MSRTFFGHRVAGLVCLAVCALPDTSRATITNVDLTSFYNDNWGPEINGSQIEAAPVAGNTGTGLTFSGYNGSFVGVGYEIPDDPTSVTIGLSSLNLVATANTQVNTLMNLLYGQVGQVDATVAFTDSHGDTATYNLVGTDTIRDYNNNLNVDFSNALSGSDPGVTARNWWNSCPTPTACNPNTNYQRLDAQTFTLPSSWAGYQLTSMIVTDPYNASGTNDVALSALQVNPIPSVPEPSTWLLLLTGGFGLFAARQLAKAKSQILDPSHVSG
jgi:hypothetical protein